MQIRLASVMVDNQEDALRFYTTVLGFVKNKDIPMGQFRWLTVSSPEGAEGAELVLEPWDSRLLRRIKRRYLPLAFQPRRSSRATSTLSTGASRRSVSNSAESQRAWDPSPPSCLRTRAATSSTSCNLGPKATIERGSPRGAGPTQTVSERATRTPDRWIPLLR